MLGISEKFLHFFTGYPSGRVTGELKKITMDCKGQFLGTVNDFNFLCIHHCEATDVGLIIIFHDNSGGTIIRKVFGF